ncbi:MULTISPECIES: type II toxin-antitoxin system HicB family antitoxin [unclassified Phyllobacterium]|uniref:type II toxin-antitoxin system HicB family antitoxin n=1 Tax=Phyllobacterium TaxID=28100 RepID=UPI000DDB57F9|nr:MULTISPECIES: type II toxin-antitoxin system HicB family antitoxin [unclassified Phyllobacterium]MBA8903737.1 putative RNase H-like HicB family nuclease [Phyllobacterium sp. P30BS-XVII]UGX85112.1 type II toxin-antitoxin system HicB family antitoxin [Phyllobacterium sp. T1293]
MRHYFALVHKDEDSAFGIQFPDIKGVYSAADKADDIVRNAVEALRLYAEDAELPAPSSHGDILARQDIRDELAAGAYLVFVPLIDNDTAVVRANVTFERGLLRAIDDTVKARGTTRSAFLASAAKREIEA